MDLREKKKKKIMLQQLEVHLLIKKNDDNDCRTMVISLTKYRSHTMLCPINYKTSSVTIAGRGKENKKGLYRKSPKGSESTIYFRYKNS